MGERGPREIADDGTAGRARSSVLCSEPSALSTEDSPLMSPTASRRSAARCPPTTPARGASEGRALRLSLGGISEWVTDRTHPRCIGTLSAGASWQLPATR